MTEHISYETLRAETVQQREGGLRIGGMSSSAPKSEVAPLTLTGRGRETTTT
jgi:hypothetical protein